MEIIITITDEQDKELRKMAIAQFGLDADATAKDALDYIVLNNTRARINEYLDNEFRKLSVSEKKRALSNVSLIEE